MLTQIGETKKIPDNLKETTTKYKAQIGRYNKIIMNDEWDEKTELMTQSVLIEHKNKLLSSKEEKKEEQVIEVLLSLRVNALQISPELKRNFVYELIRNDIINISSVKSAQFVLDLLNIKTYKLRNAVLAIISIIVSTYRGIEYIMCNGTSIIEKVIEIMKATEDGQVIQRFCIAILQKMSIKKETIEVYMKCGLIDWIIKMIQRSRTNEVHQFCLEFGSALLANIFRSNQAMDFLETNASVYQNVAETFLSMIKEKIPTNVLMHLLVCLSFMSKDKFGGLRDECKLFDRINEFKEYYKDTRVTSETAEIDKNTVLELCNQMFTQKGNGTAEKENEIKEGDVEQGELIFECFQDEVN